MHQINPFTLLPNNLSPPIPFDDEKSIAVPCQLGKNDPNRDSSTLSTPYGSSNEIPSRARAIPPLVPWTVPSSPSSPGVECPTLGENPSTPITPTSSDDYQFQRAKADVLKLIDTDL